MHNKEIRIGALYPLTGENKNISQSIRQVLDFYISLVNNPEIPAPPELEVPCIGNAKVKLIWADTQGDTLVGLAEAKRLIEEERVSAIIGSYQSSVSDVVALQAEASHIPYLCPDADAKTITQGGLKWVFRTGPANTIYTKGYFEMMENKGLTGSTVGCLAENSLLGHDEVKAVLDYSRSYGNAVKTLELYDSSLPILDDTLLKIVHSNRVFLFTMEFQDAVIETIRFFKKFKYYPRAIFHQTGTYTLKEVLDVLGKDANYVFCASVWADGLTKILPLAGKVNQMLKNRYGQGFNSISSRSFEGIYTLIDAIARAGSRNPEAIRAALTDTDIPGCRLIVPWGGIRFDEHGQNILASSMIVQILNRIPRIVWPETLAETDAVFDTPWPWYPGEPWPWYPGEPSTWQTEAPWPWTP